MNVSLDKRSFGSDKTVEKSRAEEEPWANNRSRSWSWSCWTVLPTAESLLVLTSWSC